MPNGGHREQHHINGGGCACGKTARMDYEYKDFDALNWFTYKVWLVFRTHSKWTIIEEGNATGSPQKGFSSTNSSSFLHSSDPGDAMEEETTTATIADRERYRIGTKKAKEISQEEMRTAAVRSMAESEKRKSDSLEEKNAILVLSQPEVANHLDTKTFFAAMRQTYLNSALKKAQISKEDNAASSSSSLLGVPNTPPSDRIQPATESTSPKPASYTTPNTDTQTDLRTHDVAGRS